MRAATKHAPTKTTAEPAHLWVPEFITLDRFELNIFTNVLRDSHAMQVYVLLREYSDFVSGEFNGGYHNLMALCTPPKPERGQRRPGPSYEQLRRIINDLVAVGLVQRPNPTQNQLQGQLRLQLTHVFRKGAPVELDNRVSNRVQASKNQMKSTLSVAKPADTPQGLTHGYQGVNTSFNGSKSGELSTTVEDITRPPEGAQNGPQGTAPGQVAATLPMAGKAAPDQLTPRPPLHEGEKQPAPSSEGGISAVGKAALAELRRIKEKMAETDGVPFKDKFGPKKPMPTGVKPSRSGGKAPPALQKDNSRGWIGNLLSGP